ncbi:AMP-binding enzyme [Popillia japonica]|uniref:AMP-binding enzyme n=1 Tax=Popillia japonica TaxID=7064 RepID=A0AAW1LWW3_POPJA
MLTDGVKIVTLPKFAPVDYMNSVKTHKPHVLLLVPPLVMFMSSFPGVKPEYLSSLRTIYCGGAPLGGSDETKMREKAGKPISILQAYGLTETVAATMTPHSLQGKYPGSMGKAIPNTFLKVIAVDDNAGKHLPPDTTGELLIKGPQVMKCYYNQPEKTREAFLNGWFKSGDLVTYNKDGILYIVDRIKDLIKVKALQVAPAEIEEVLREYEGVQEAAVIGIPHKLSGEVPRAYVVPKKDAKIDVNKLNEYVTSKLAKHKRIDGGIVLVPQIPKTPVGKILRRLIRLEYLKERSQDKDKK